MLSSTSAPRHPLRARRRSCCHHGSIRCGPQASVGSHHNSPAGQASQAVGCTAWSRGQWPAHRRPPPLRSPGGRRRERRGPGPSVQPSPGEGWTDGPAHRGRRRAAPGSAARRPGGSPPGSGEGRLDRHPKPALLALPDQPLGWAPLPAGRRRDASSMALLERLLPPSQRPQRQRASAAAGLGRGQRDHPPAGGLVTVAWAPGAWRVGSSGQVWPMKAVEPSADPQGREPHPRGTRGRSEPLRAPSSSGPTGRPAGPPCATEPSGSVPVLLPPSRPARSGPADALQTVLGESRAGARKKTAK